MRILAFLFLVVFTSQLEHIDGRCFEDMTSCLSELRNLMTSEDAFWFGEHYHETICIVNGTIRDFVPCQNADIHKSVLARYYSPNTVPTGIENSLGFVDVIYNAPNGSFNAFGLKFDVPAVHQHRVNPLEQTRISMWSLRNIPEVTWDSDNSSYYTVFIWDLGNFFPHGFFINAMNGNMSTGTPLIPYFAPENPRTTANPHLFVVIGQVGHINSTTAGMALRQVLDSDGNRIRPTRLFDAMPNTWTDPIAVNLMHVPGDPYSSQYMKSNYIINTFPWFASQVPPLYTMLHLAGIPPSVGQWSDNETTPHGELYIEEAPYLHELNVDLSVEYDSDDLTITSCCVQTTYRKALYRVNPLSTDTARPVLLRNTPIIRLSPVYITANLVEQVTERPYTLLFVDMTDAAYQSSQQSYGLHWLVTDIQHGEINTGNEVLPYEGPGPSDMDRVYVFMLFEQQEAVLDSFDITNYVGPDCPPGIKNRCNARISEMATDLNFRLAGITMMNVTPDAYSRFVLYDYYKFAPKSEICNGIPGFAEPCPEPEVCDNAIAVTPSLVLVSMAIMSVLTKLF